MRRLVPVLLLLAVARTAGAAPSPSAGDSTGQSPNAGKTSTLDRVVAVVNDSVILQSELDARLVPLRAQVKQINDPQERARRMAKLSSQVLDEMVNEELIVQAAKAAKIEVNSTEVQAALDEIKHNNKLDDAGLKRALSAQGYTLANYKADLRRQLLRLRAINQLVAPKVTVTEEDVRARYDQLKRRSDSVSSVQLSHILFKLPAHPTEQQVDAARKQAAKAIERVKNGESFASVAKQMSQDTSTAASGGMLGWFERGSINPAWEQIVFSMQKGDVRGPVRGTDGLHVFYVSATKKSALKPFAQMKEQLARQIRRRHVDKATQTWIAGLRKKAYIDIKL